MTAGGGPPLKTGRSRDGFRKPFPGDSGRTIKKRSQKHAVSIPDDERTAVFFPNRA